MRANLDNKDISSAVRWDDQSHHFIRLGHSIIFVADLDTSWEHQDPLIKHPMYPCSSQDFL